MFYYMVAATGFQSIGDKYTVFAKNKRTKPKKLKLVPEKYRGSSEKVSFYNLDTILNVIKIFFRGIY